MTLGRHQLTISDIKIDQLLSSALRDGSAAWPTEWTQGCDAVRVVERIAYHGIAGLIVDEAQRLSDWPATVLDAVHYQGIALAMWELRHKAILITLLAALANEKILALLLKGTALAYDLYPNPATRARGDSDLLISAADLGAVRDILSRSGFRRQASNEETADDFALQEVWSLSWEGQSDHHIDLHWQLLNAPALRGILEFSDCSVQPTPLLRLGPDALAMSRVLTLIHTCIHRAMHITSPYFVDGLTYYGGDRLIWAKDIHLLAGALTQEEWTKFCGLARAQGVAGVCLEGLNFACTALGTKVPDWVIQKLGTAGPERASAYLLDLQQMGRAWRDVSAIQGWYRKLAYVGARTLPAPSFMRSKYPTMARSSVAFLYVRRMIDLFRTRR